MDKIFCLAGITVRSDGECGGPGTRRAKLKRKRNENIFMIMISRSKKQKKLIKTCVVDTIGLDAKLPLLVCDTVASRHCLVFRTELYHRQSFHVFALVEYCHYYLVSDIYELRPMHKRHVHALLPVGPMPKFQRAVRRLSGHISDRVMHVVRLPVYFFNNKKL